MISRDQTPDRGARRLFGLAIALTIGISGGSAEARLHHRFLHGANYHPPYAAIVVDDNSGEVLYEVDADGPRHPASLTKIMTLYLLFEQLEAGRLALDSRLQVSPYAASQPPTRLGLRPGQTISVDEAIRAIVTRSANDAAVVVSEAVAGSEQEFAKLMSRKARMLGMGGTAYVNASGLPADEQWTTARDQALLGRAIQMRFPDLYRYFATASFVYRRIAIRNHNSLLGTVDGVDGIKTGYTEASGYNLVSSVRRDARHIVGVILGETSNAARDAHMRQLIDGCIARASVERTAPAIAELADPEPTVVGSIPASAIAGTPDQAARDPGPLPQATAKSFLTAGAP